MCRTSALIGQSHAGSENHTRECFHRSCRYFIKQIPNGFPYRIKGIPNVFRARHCDSNTRDVARIPKSVKEHIHIYTTGALIGQYPCLDQSIFPIIAF